MHSPPPPNHPRTRRQNLTVERATVIGAGAEMHDMGRDPDQEDAKAAEQSLSKFILLTLCQKVFNAIIKSESEVPNAFRDIFRHVQVREQGMAWLLLG